MRAASRRAPDWGLSITKKFAELLGGTISDEVGEGSTFTVRVPVTYQPPEA